MPVEATPIEQQSSAGNFMQRGTLWLAGQLQQHAGRQITYRRLGKWSGPIVSRLQKYDVIDAEGIVTSFTSYDWSLRRTALSALLCEPRVGDELIENINGFDQTYEVMPIGDKPHFENLDTSNLILLVHTKKVR